VIKKNEKRLGQPYKVYLPVRLLIMIAKGKKKVLRGGGVTEREKGVMGKVQLRT